VSVALVEEQPWAQDWRNEEVRDLRILVAHRLRSWRSQRVSVRRSWQGLHWASGDREILV
jgi:hypothetical protein